MSLDARLELYGGWCKCSQPKLVIWFCVSVADCDLTLSSNNRKPDLRSPGRFLRIACFNFDNVSRYLVALMVPTSKKSTQK
ncbi:hypothetical protein TNCV_2627441 [Trichonephila clavipes]|uniref:Uncharacterized protein n=1 Tax=Trichonephila clavipes TaxID=2585209 RepID=A0A8X6W7G3_TRICX|nr:hypothetical protein TNCV_2627441 [Trichonephila clavipes]